VRVQPDARAGGWNRAAIDEDAVIADFQAGASVNAVCNTHGIGWKRAKQLQTLAMNDGYEVIDNESEDMGGDDSGDDSGAGDPDDAGEE
jgi:hypothetical protein